MEDMASRWFAEELKGARPVAPHHHMTTDNGGETRWAPWTLAGYGT